MEGRLGFTTCYVTLKAAPCDQTEQTGSTSQPIRTQGQNTAGKSRVTVFNCVHLSNRASYLYIVCVCVSIYIDFVYTSTKAGDVTELEASMEMTDRHSGSSFRYDTYRSRNSLCKETARRLLMNHPHTFNFLSLLSVPCSW